jgi:hypothetical protein
VLVQREVVERALGVLAKSSPDAAAAVAAHKERSAAVSQLTAAKAQLKKMKVACVDFDGCVSLVCEDE